MQKCAAASALGSPLFSGEVTTRIVPVELTPVLYPGDWDSEASRAVSSNFW